MLGFESEFLIRACLALGFFGFVPIAGYYRIKAHGTGESLDRKQEGWFLLIGIRLTALILFGGIITFIVSPALLNWSSMGLPLTIRWLGVLVGPLAGVLWIYTFHHLGKNLTDTVVVRKEAYLVKSGPYRYVRHPFYVVVLLLALANGLASDSWFILVGGLLMFALLRARTVIEEQKLIEKFGDEYREFMKTTGRFFPKI